MTELYLGKAIFEKLAINYESHPSCEESEKSNKEKDQRAFLIRVIEIIVRAFFTLIWPTVF